LPEAELAPHAEAKPSRLRDRTFAHVFSNISVYSLLYEDSEVDERFLEIDGDSTILGISGAGCRIAGHVSQHPKSIDAVDINRHHLALTALKVSAVRHVREPEALHTVFGDVPGRDPRPYIGRAIDPLPGWIRAYWRSRASSLRHGLLGRGLTAQLLGWLRFLAGIDEAMFRRLIAKPVGERLEMLNGLFEPLLRRKDVSTLLRSPICLLALGVNYAQRDRMLSAEKMDLINFLMQHIRRVGATDLARNWFGWFAFTGRFNAEDEEALPPYLRQDRHARSLDAPTKVHYHHRNVFNVLDDGAPGTWSHFVLCDALDWMAEPVQHRLLTSILRTSREGGVLQYRSVEPHSIVQRLGLERHFQRMEAVSNEATVLDRTCQYRSVNLYRIVH
jgi:S-adenosylmethionine-diacylglycerol 3-amino-3-carboxypropyl transferase